MLNNKEDILKLIQEDVWMMDILRAAQTLHLPDWWVCAGFVRSKIWDTLHHVKDRTPLADVDVIYFDPERIDEQEEKRLEGKLRSLLPDVPWSVKNEARMHTVNGIPPYTSSVDAIAKFPETATALGVKLDDDQQLILAAPCGVSDVINMLIKPTAYFEENEERRIIYENRIVAKDWQSIWANITVHHW